MAEELSLVISNPNGGEFLKTIGWNKKEFMDKVAAITQQYNGLTYTEEQMKSAKADRARLNAMKEAISNRRIEVKNAVMAPYTQFEKEVKEVVALIDGPISMIDSQIKEYEERVKAEKKQKLKALFQDIASEYEFLTFDQIFEQRYLNATVSLNKANEDIKRKVEKVASDFQTIDAFTSEKYRGAAKDVYMRTLSLSAALSEDKRLTEIDKRQEEERILREKKRLREQEALAAAMTVPKKPVQKESPSAENPVFPEADFSKNGTKEPENSKAHQESVPEPEKSVEEPQASEAAVNDPFALQEDTKQYKASFTVYGTKAQIMALKQYMIDNGIKFGKAEK